MQAENDARWAASPRAVLELFVLRACQPAWGTEPAAADAQHAEAARKTPPAEGISGEAVPAGPDAGNGIPAEPPAGREPIPLPLHGKFQTAPKAPDPPAPIVLPFPTAPRTMAKTPREAWNNMLARLQKVNPGLHAMVHRGKYGGYQNGTFTLALEGEDEILSVLLSQDERAGQISSLLSEEMGTPAAFSTGGPPTGQAPSQGDPFQDKNLEALAKVFGRDKIVVKKNGAT